MCDPIQHQQEERATFVRVVDDDAMLPLAGACHVDESERGVEAEEDMLELVVQDVMDAPHVLGPFSILVLAPLSSPPPLPLHQLHRHHVWRIRNSSVALNASALRSARAAI